MKRLVYTPSTSESTAQCPVIEATRSCGFGQRSVSPDGHQLCAVIVSLLRRRCPSAVLGAVVAIVVDAIDAMRRRRSWTHVLQERLKGVAPPVADLYSTSAVVPEFVVVRVPAAAIDRCPCPMFRCSSLSVRSRSIPRKLCGQAPAGPRRPGAQMGTSDFSDRSAVALTRPHCRHTRPAAAPCGSLVRCPLDYRPATEPLPCEINGRITHTRNNIISWRPGRPHIGSWSGHWETAWETVEETGW